MSSPCSRMYCLCSISLSRTQLLEVRADRCSRGTRSITSRGQMEAVQFIQHGHVERRGGRAFFLIAAHVQIVRDWCGGRSGGESARDSRGTRR